MLSTQINTLPSNLLTNGIRRELNDAFETFFGHVNGTSPADAMMVPLTIWNNDRHIVLELDVPGIQRDDLELSYKEGKLCISGERGSFQKERHPDYNERSFGRFQREIMLPEEIESDSIEAELADGILHVTLTKIPEAQPVKIRIQTNDEGRGKRLTDQES